MYISYFKSCLLRIGRSAHILTPKKIIVCVSKIDPIRLISHLYNHRKMPRTGSNYRVLSLDDRLNICFELLSSYEGDRLPHGKVQELADRYRVNGTTISRLGRRALEANQNPDNIFDGIGSRRKNCGRRSNYNLDEISAAVENLGIEKRRTIRDVAEQVGVPKSTLHRLMKQTGFLRPHTSAVKPILTDENKNARVEFCRRHIGDNGRYAPMNNIIHVDEKWFYVTQTSTRCYLTADEVEPHRTTRHKNHIEKVCFWLQ